jgi:hypothetical protein
MKATGKTGWITRVSPGIGPALPVVHARPGAKLYRFERSEKELHLSRQFFDSLTAHRR